MADRGEVHFITRVICLRYVISVMLCLSVGNTYAGKPQYYHIDLPAQPLTEALNSLSELTDVPVIFPYDLVKNRNSNPVIGQYLLQQALDILLQDTGLTGGLSKKGVIIISLKAEDEPKNEDMKMKKKTSLLPLLAGIMSIFAAAPVAAQDTGRVLEEVMVTAQKRAENLQDVPVTVTAYTGDTLIEMGIEDTQKLMAVTPGLVFNNTGATNQPYLRGVGTRFAVAGLEPSVATYLDDQYVNRTHALLFDFFDVQRVEVLKGPQGTLFGRNASGGAMRVITNEVTDEMEGDVTLTAGNFDHFGFKGAFNLPITDSLGVRVAAIHKRRDGYVDNISTLPGVHDEYDDQDALALRGKLRWDITDRTTLRLSLTYSKSEDMKGAESQAVTSLPNTGFNRGGISATAVDEVALDVPASEEQDLEHWYGAARLEHDFDFAQFVSITTVSYDEAFFPFDADGTDAEVINSFNSEHDYESLSQEFQLISNPGGKLDWLVGLYYFEEEIDYEGAVDVSAPVGRLSVGNQNVETEAYAVFGQATWNFDEHWALTFGARYSEEEKDLFLGDSLIGLPVIFPVVQTPLTDSKNWDSFTPRVTLEYRTDNDILFFATFASGFKSGGYNVPAFTQTATINPEEIDMYEFGMKGDFFDSRLRLNGTFFYYDYVDLQVSRAATSIGGGAVSVSTENAADAELYGVDLEATWLVTDHTSLSAGLNLMDSEYQDYTAAAKIFTAPAAVTDVTSNVPFIADGHELLRAPGESFFVNLIHDMPLDNGGNVGISMNYSWKSEYRFDFIAPNPGGAVANQLQNDSYGLLNARVTYTTPNQQWRVSLWGNNIADEEYFVDSIIAGSGLRVTYGPPLTFGVDINYRF